MGARLLVSLVPVCAVLIPVLIPFLPIRIPYISELKSGLCGSPPVRVHQIHDVSMPLREGATLFSRPEGLPGSHRVRLLNGLLLRHWRKSTSCCYGA